MYTMWMQHFFAMKKVVSSYFFACSFAREEEEKIAFGWGLEVGLAMNKIDMMKYKCVNEQKKVSFFECARLPSYMTQHSHTQ